MIDITRLKLLQQVAYCYTDILFSVSKQKKIIYFNKYKMTEPNFSVKTLLFDYFKKKKGYFFAYLFLILAYPLGSIVVPYQYGKLIEQMSVGKEMKQTFINTLIIWIASILGTSGVSRIDTVLITDLRSYLYHNIAKFIFDIHKEDCSSIKIGELISKLSKLPYLILELFYQFRSCYTPLLYMIIFCLFYFFSVNVRLGSMILIVILAFAGVAYLSSVSCMSSCTNAEASGDLANENLQDILDNIISVYSADNIEGELKAFHDKDSNLRKNMRKCLSCGSKFKLVFSTLYLVSFIIVSTYCYKLYQSKIINLSQISSTLIIMVYLLSQLDSTMQYTQDTIAYFGSIIDIQNYIDKLNTKYSQTCQHINKLNEELPIYNQEIDRIEGRVDFKNVDMCFGEDNCVLKNFSYTIQPHTKTAIVGKIGTGKSSLLKMILKLTYPNKGNVLIDGKNLPYNIVRKFVSYINQTPILFNRSLYENIVYGTNKTREDVIKLLEKYNLQNIFGKHTLDSNVGKGGTNLSGGQRQIVILLRTIFKNSSIILLDEPTTALDEHVRNFIFNLIFEIFKDKTIIMITHDPELVPKFDNILDLNNYTNIKPL